MRVVRYEIQSRPLSGMCVLAQEQLSRRRPSCWAGKSRPPPALFSTWSLSRSGRSPHPARVTLCAAGQRRRKHYDLVWRVRLSRDSAASRVSVNSTARASTRVGAHSIAKPPRARLGVRAAARPTLAVRALQPSKGPGDPRTTPDSSHAVPRGMAALRADCYSSGALEVGALATA